MILCLKLPSLLLVAELYQNLGVLTCKKNLLYLAASNCPPTLSLVKLCSCLPWLPPPEALHSTWCLSKGPESILGYALAALWLLFLNICA